MVWRVRPEGHMGKLQVFCVWPFCNTTIINAIIQFFQNTSQYVHVNSRSSYCDALFKIVYTCREGRNMNPVLYVPL
jgi:hypothetical protein